MKVKRDAKVVIYAPIEKIDEAERMVYGYASTEALDTQKERISKAAVTEALGDYMQWANIREMHSKTSAVGVAKSADIDEKGLYVAAKVVDDAAWNKVVEGVYKGFSLGGTRISKVDDTITKMIMTEISLVDRPANPECRFEVYKAEGAKDDEEGKYGDVEYADTKNKKYPVDTEKHIRAAWSYINQEKNSSKYDADELKAIKGKIVAAWKDKIDKDGPPSAADKAADALDIKKYMGEEVYDASTALNALGSIMYLLQGEMGEDEIDQEQIDDLQVVVDKLKAFISSEIMEDNSIKLAAASATDIQKAVRSTWTALQLEEFKKYWDSLSASTVIEKKGARNSAGDQQVIQTIHDHSVALGATCQAGEAAEQVGAKGVGSKEAAASAEDIQKAVRTEYRTNLSKAMGLRDGEDVIEAITKIMATNTSLTKRVAELAAQPDTSKAPVLKVVGKDADVLTDHHEADIRKIATGEGTDDPKEIIKAIHQTGGEPLEKR